MESTYFAATAVCWHFKRRVEGNVCRNYSESWTCGLIDAAVLCGVFPPPKGSPRASSLSISAHCICIPSAQTSRSAPKTDSLPTGLWLQKTENKYFSEMLREVLARACVPVVYNWVEIWTKDKHPLGACFNVDIIDVLRQNQQNKNTSVRTTVNKIMCQT